MTPEKPNYAPAPRNRQVSGVGSAPAPLIITTASRDEWYRRNPHVRRGVLEDLAARGILLIVEPASGASKIDCVVEELLYSA